jgi:hypothetical protein
MDDAAKKEKRREDARVARDALEAQKQEQILAKISKKKAHLIAATAQASAALAAAAAVTAPPSPPLPASQTRSTPPPKSPPRSLEDQILALELELHSVRRLSAVSRFGLERQLQVLKAKAAREARGREKERLEQEERLAELRVQDRPLDVGGLAPPRFLDEPENEPEPEPVARERPRRDMSDAGITKSLEDNDKLLRALAAQNSLRSLKQKVGMRRSSSTANATAGVGARVREEEEAAPPKGGWGAGAAPFGNAFNER